MTSDQRHRIVARRLAAGGLAVLLAATMSAASLPWLDAFKAGVASYIVLRGRVEGSLPRREIFTDADDARAAVNRFAAAMRAIRPGAREGDIFSATIAPEVRRLVNAALREHGHDRDMPGDPLDLKTPPAGRPLAVHDSFPWQQGNLMPSCVLSVLPELPAVLHYRLVGPDLVLVDVDASLVVDILRDVRQAVAPPSQRRAHRVNRHAAVMLR